jgi:hypothetical protein
MKRLYSFVLMLIMVFSMSTTVFAAASKSYQLDDLGMSIDIPSEYVTFTRNISDSDPNLATYGLTKKDLSDLMNTRNIYLNAWDKDVTFEIIVTMVDSTITDFNLMSDTVLNTLASSFKSEYANSGVTVEKYEVYQHDQAKFIKIYISQPNGSDKAYGLQYYTVYDNKAINVTMQSYSGKIDSSKEAILQSIVSTVHFVKEPLKLESVPDTAAFTYKDKDTGAEFIVPANWTQDTLSKDRQFLDVKFTSNKEPGLSILYGSTDMWGEMSASEKKGYSRADLNNEIFTVDEFAETMGVPKSNVSTVSYGNKEYYKYTTVMTSSSYGVNLEATMTCLMRIENGYAYTFQFSGDNKNAYYKDFESLLGSVKYPEIQGGTIVNGMPEFSAVNILLSLLVTIIIYSVPIIIYRYGIARRPIEKGKAKKITIIYAVIAFIAMSVLIFVINGSGAAGGAILLWSWINYKVLTTGKAQNEEKSNESEPVAEAVTHIEPVAIEPAVKMTEMPVHSNRILSSSMSAPIVESQPVETGEGPDDIVFCYKCGTKLSKSNQFCHKCGTKIVK